MSIFFEIAAANATAPPGSKTILKYLYAIFIAVNDSVSLTEIPPLKFFLLISKVILPGLFANNASHIE